MGSESPDVIVSLSGQYVAHSREPVGSMFLLGAGR